MPVLVDLELARMSGPVETAAYFFVNEALTNIAGHAGAGSTTVHGWVHRGGLIITVADARRATTGTAQHAGHGRPGRG